MAKTVEQGFNEFLTDLIPSKAETAAAVSHRKSIEDCLKAGHGITSFFRTGSFGNGTNISGFSDVDYFAVTPGANLNKDSAASLRAFRDTLDKRFPTTGVRVSCPAVKVPFGGGTENTEVLPVYVEAAKDGLAVYGIPDCQGGWMKSSPKIHNAYVTEINKKMSDRVKPLVRFIKAWKFYNNVKISSFYLEMRVAEYASKETTIVYSVDVKNMFIYLKKIGLAQMQDPTGTSGYIAPTYSPNHLADALSKLDTAITRSQNARNYESQGDHRNAFDWWDKVYNGNFPSYY